MPNPTVAVDALQRALDEERRLRIKAEEHITYLTKTTDYTPPTKEHVEKIQKQVKIAKMVNNKINKEIKKMKKDWASATEHLGQQISDLQKEVNDLKAKRRDGYDVHKQREQDWYSSYMKLKEENEQLTAELRKKNPVIFQKTYQLQKEEIETLKAQNEKLKDVINSQKNYCDKLNKEIHELKNDFTDARSDYKLMLESAKKKDEVIKQREGYIKHQQTEMKQQESIIEYHELREMYMEKYIQEYGCCHQFREMVEETAHKNGNKKHVGILFDD